MGKLFVVSMTYKVTGWKTSTNTWLSAYKWTFSPIW